MSDQTYTVKGIVVRAGGCLAAGINVDTFDRDLVKEQLIS